ncbi:Hypothetical protein A7982_07579 [Minicystis rosea]|nr:Hypothetical protein A7982_07579 [Minicystis rosea]
MEVLAGTADGHTCSNIDAARGCLGKKDALIDPEMVRIQASSGAPAGDMEDFLWMPSPNVLDTADTGMVLRAWLEKMIEGQAHRSPVAETRLRPNYTCQRARAFSFPPARQGESGGRGPDLQIAITHLRTPFYPDAALLRITSDEEVVYAISPTDSQPIHIISRGQPGGKGEPGERGRDGRAGTAGKACGDGGDGQPGGDGAPGGPGGSGGRGGSILVVYDSSGGERLLGRVLPESVGGAPGAGGSGGLGGDGGEGGAAGPTDARCVTKAGSRGVNGGHGEDGFVGAPGRAGPPPILRAAPRDALFAQEMDAISRIEAAADRKIAK